MSRPRNPNIKKPITIAENLLFATTKSDDRNGINLPKSMEAWFESETKALIWGERIDVMYSFMSIYALGIWAYNSDNEDFCIADFKRSSSKLFYKLDKCLVWNGDYLNRVQGNDQIVGKLNNNPDMLHFARHYFSLGNLMPIWPGGNVPKGDQNNSFFDIPELYFHYHRTWFDVIKRGFENVFLDDLFTEVGATYDHGLKDFFNSVHSEETYNAFLHHVVTVIKTREEKIRKWMSDNNIVVKDSWDYQADD